MANAPGRVWVIRGGDWGDEGKGKITDLLLDDEEIGATARYNGGRNAGHSMKIGDIEVVTHLIPSGIFRSQTRKNLKNYIGRGTVVDLAGFFQEKAELERAGIMVTPDNLGISNGAHLTLKYHLALEQARESGPGKKHTTKRGIWPTYASKHAYQGIRAGDTKDIDYVWDTIQLPLSWTNAILQHCYGQEPIPADEVMAEIEKYRHRLIPFLVNEAVELNGVIRQGKIVLAEGAQGARLDIDEGDYPNTSASSNGAGAIQAGCGLHPCLIAREIVVIKAYMTAVGDNHCLVSEFEPELAEAIRVKGNEYGSTTKRPRRTAARDNFLARHCTPGTELVVTKLDILSQIDQIPVCSGYTDNGRMLTEFPESTSALRRCKPIFEMLPGWQQDISGATKFQDLPVPAIKYLQFITEPFADMRMSMIGTGKDRRDIITLS